MMETQRVHLHGLRAVLRTQGRNARWLAGHVGVSDSLLCHAMSGRKTVDGRVAEMSSALLGVPVSMLIEYPNGYETSSKEVAA